jgi:hypothetical protein
MRCRGLVPAVVYTECSPFMSSVGVDVICRTKVERKRATVFSIAAICQVALTVNNASDLKLWRVAGSGFHASVLRK